MKLNTQNCPECGEPAIYTVEHLYAWASLTEPDGNGHVDYEGESKMLWDTQVPIEDPETGGIYVRCINNHEWSTTVEE